MCFYIVPDELRVAGISFWLWCLVIEQGLNFSFLYLSASIDVYGMDESAAMVVWLGWRCLVSQLKSMDKGGGRHGVSGEYSLCRLEL